MSKLLCFLQYFCHIVVIFNQLTSWTVWISETRTSNSTENSNSITHNMGHWHTRQFWSNTRPHRLRVGARIVLICTNLGNYIIKIYVYIDFFPASRPARGGVVYIYYIDPRYPLVRRGRAHNINWVCRRQRYKLNVKCHQDLRQDGLWVAAATYKQQMRGDHTRFFIFGIFNYFC